MMPMSKKACGLMNPSDADDGRLVSLSGAPIYKHGEATEWAPPAGEEFIEQISAHIEAHLGPVETVFHEIVSDTVHIDVHFVRATRQSPVHRLVTSGMSDLPMHTPDGADVPRHVELMISLPMAWQLDQDSLKDERWYWPIRTLKFLARMPHKYHTWLGLGHTVPNGDPPEPYADNTKLCGAIVLPSVSVDSAFEHLHIESAKDITFYAVVPLFEPEMNFKLRDGTDALLKRFAKHDVSDVVSLTRPDVSKRRFGLW
jgi:Suppressor of fused protein (SUFU)